jgi:hypothetical protein
MVEKTTDEVKLYPYRRKSIIRLSVTSFPAKSILWQACSMIYLWEMGTTYVTVSPDSIIIPSSLSRAKLNDS